MKRLNLTRVRNADGEGCAGGTTTTVDADADADADAANGTGAGTGPVTCGASTSAAKSLTARLGWQRLTLLPSFLVLVLFVTWLWFRQADLDAISENALSNGQVAKALRQHVELTAISTFFVLVIAIPLGVLLTRRAFRRATPVAMAVANIGQAAPAIGLLALLVIWLGIGRKAALIGIVAYAVLPVLSNTIAGLKANDPTLLEAARGIGMSSTGVLARVELPLAVPLILAGVRTALVLNVGTATLAAFGGGGGLGVLITTGITNQRMPVLMLGSVLTVVLALLVDWLASLAELLWRPRVGGGDMRQGCAFLAGSLLLAALVPACGLTSGSPMVDDVEPGSIGKGKPLSGAELTVTSKSFTENLILGAMMGIAFEAVGAEVLDRTGIQGPFGAREAVRKGDADGMYEYTGTAWITYQGNSEPIADPHAQWRAVRDADLKDGLTWLSPSALNNTYALAMNEANLRKYGTKTLTAVSELSAARPKAVTLCVEGEFANRADGLPGMERTYGMSLPAGNITQVDTGIIYTQAAKGSCVYGEVFTTDGRIKSMNLAVMADDRKFFPNYNAAPEINSKALKKWPAIAEVLDPVTAKLTNAVARELNARVDVEGEDPHQVALDWMKAEGLVK